MEVLLEYEHLRLPETIYLSCFVFQRAKIYVCLKSYCLKATDLYIVHMVK